MASFKGMADFSALRLLVFRIADLTCATDVGAVREILDAPPATRIPGAPEAVEGLINIRGELLTLVDGTRLLGRAATEARDGRRILLLEAGGRTVALGVDDVLDLVTVAADDLAGREELPGLDPALVRAVGRRDDRSFVLLDLDALLDPILTT